MNTPSYIKEGGSMFFVTYNAIKGFLLILFVILFSILCIYLGVEYELQIVFIIFFLIILLISIFGIPYSLKNIFDGNRGVHWGGDHEGIFIGPPSVGRSIYAWNEIREIRLVKKLKYIEYTNEHCSAENAVLIHVEKLKDPLSGYYSDFVKRFDDKKDGSKVLLEEYPKNEEKHLIDTLSRYSQGRVVVSKVDSLEYQFGE